MTERDAHVRCIRRKGGEAFCGRDIMLEWAFVDFEHAQRAESRGDRLEPCAACYDLAGEAALAEWSPP